MMRLMNRPGISGKPLWHDGWYLQHAHRLASPNFGPRPPSTVVDLMVLHSISLPPGVYGGHYVQDLFTNQLDWALHPYFGQIEGLQGFQPFLYPAYR
jgi:AmpD protein